MEKTSKETFYITTPIYYVNDVAHIGHAYTTIIADALARFHKLAGMDVFFLTGTDEHGQKIEKAAASKGLTPLELADQMVVKFQELWKSLNISYDFFIRTTNPIHEKGVQAVFTNLKEQGDIYKGTYQGWYCTGEENFLTEDIPLDDDGCKTCPDCGRKAAVVSEDCYFFRLSAYQKPLLDFYAAHPRFVRPQSRMNEVVSFVRQGLKDLSITRTTVRWGIPVPDDPEHTIYVWFDALHNYLTAIGYDWDQELYERFWPADMHLIGKDILRFHAIFWPAFLMAAGFPLPSIVYGHGWWLKDDAKMSKSKGNVLDPYPILKTFGPDPLRYFLLREIPIGMDGNFSHEAFIQRANSDLANDLGNLVHRTLTMIESYFKGDALEAEDKSEEDQKLEKDFSHLKERVFEHYSGYALNKALEDIWAYVYEVNKYLANQEPWIVAKDSSRKPRLARILLQAAAAIRGIAYLVYPVMPGSSEKIWALMGEEKMPADVLYRDLQFEDPRPDRKFMPPQPLFPRVALKDFLGEDTASTRPDPQLERTPKEGKTMDMVTFDEFKKMDLRVGHILKAEAIPGATKLLKVEVDIGTEKRTMVAGVAETYKPEELEGKKLIVIVNLKPAVIRGIESQAMLLAAVVDDKAIIPFFDKDLPAGTPVM